MVDTSLTSNGHRRMQVFARFFLSTFVKTTSSTFNLQTSKPDWTGCLYFSIEPPQKRGYRVAQLFAISRAVVTCNPITITLLPCLYMQLPCCFFVGRGVFSIPPRQVFGAWPFINSWNPCWNLMELWYRHRAAENFAEVMDGFDKQINNLKIKNLS